MLQDVYWHQENRIVVATYLERLTLEDLEAAVYKIIQMVKDSNRTYPIHVIHTLPEDATFDRSIYNVGGLITALKPAQVYASGGLSIIVHKNPNTVVQSLAEAVATILRLPFRVVTSFDEAIALLHNIDTSLTESAQVDTPIEEN